MKIDPGADCWRNIIADEEDDKDENDDIMIWPGNAEVCSHVLSPHSEYLQRVSSPHLHCPVLVVTGPASVSIMMRLIDLIYY